MRAALSLYCALRKVSFAFAAGNYVERELYVQFVAIVIYFIRLIGVALNVAVQREVDCVKNGTFSAARLAEYAENAALQKRSKVYNRSFGKAVKSAEFKFDRSHSSSVSERKSSKRSGGTSLLKRER